MSIIKEPTTKVDKLNHVERYVTFIRNHIAAVRNEKARDAWTHERKDDSSVVTEYTIDDYKVSFTLVNPDSAIENDEALAWNIRMTYKGEVIAVVEYRILRGSGTVFWNRLMWIKKSMNRLCKIATTNLVAFEDLDEKSINDNMMRVQHKVCGMFTCGIFALYTDDEKLHSSIF